MLFFYSNCNHKDQQEKKCVLHGRAGSCQWTCLPTLLPPPAPKDFLALYFQLFLVRHITQKPLIKTERGQCNAVSLRKEEKKTNTMVLYQLYSSPFPQLLLLITWSDFWKSSLTSVLTNLQIPILFILSLDILGDQFLCIFLSQSTLYNLMLSPFLKSVWKSVCLLLLDLVTCISW